MGACIEGEKGFIDYFIEQSIASQSFLAKPDALPDWEPFEKYLSTHIRRGSAAAGQPSYPSLVMFKILILQFLYKLSDDGASGAICGRISFLHFVGLPFNSSKPDGTTIRRFRNKLLEKGTYEHLLNLFNQQLEAGGLLVKQGVAVDATLISSARRPRKVIEIASVPHDRCEEETPLPTNDNVQDGELKTSYSDDSEATWTVKGGKPVYGYKAHAATDTEHGFIPGGHVTGANVADTKELEQVFSECALPVSEEEKKGNSIISKTRWIVERSFGTIKNVQGYVRSRYLGRAKVEMEFLLHALVRNMKKAINLSAS